MLCMYFASQDITTVGMKYLLMSGNPASFEAMEIARDGLLRVRDKLYRLQATMELGQPDIGKLRDALTRPKTDTSKQDLDTMTLKSLKTDDLMQQSKAEALLPEYKNKIDLCVAKITG